MIRLHRIFKNLILAALCVLLAFATFTKPAAADDKETNVGGAIGGSVGNVAGTVTGYATGVGIFSDKPKESMGTAGRVVGETVQDIGKGVYDTFTKDHGDTRHKFNRQDFEDFDKFQEKQQKMNDFAPADATYRDRSIGVNMQIGKDGTDYDEAMKIKEETEKRNYADQHAVIEEKDPCPDALKPDPNLNVTTPNSSNLFASQILSGIKVFMLNVYKSLARLLMLGHALVCYAIKIDYTCLGIGDACAGKIPNLSFLIAGAMIYVTGTLMAMAIGMYFVDISFKLGFAVLFMPISIALWPFPPTQNKLSDNLSIIIRCGMLFMMVAIAVSYAIILITQGVFNPTVITEEQFWDAIANKSTGLLSEGFSLDTISMLIILFCLIYGFKILSASANKYVDYFFKDAAFGSESPMHMMGTQAFGMVAQNTIKPALSLAGDIALTQTGRAISGTVTGVSKLGSAEGRKEWADAFRSVGRGIKRTTSAIRNPRQTYNQAMQYGGELANKGIHAAGSVVKEAVDIGIIPFTANEEFRDRVSKSMDKGINYLGGKTENIIAHGGGKMRSAAIKAAQNITDTEKQKDFVAKFGAAALNAVGVSNPEATAAGLDKITPEQVREQLHNLNTALKDKKAEVGQAVMAQAVELMARSTGKSEEEVLQGFIDFGKKVDNVADKGKQLGNTAVRGGVALALAAKTGVLGVLSLPDRGVNLIEALGKSVINSKFAQDRLDNIVRANAAINSAPITLQPSALISAPFKAAAALYNWRETLEKLSYSKGKLDKLRAQGYMAVLKAGGGIVLRSVGRTVKGTAEDAKNYVLSPLGSILKGFGDSLADNSDHRTKFTSPDAYLDDAEREKIKKQEDDAYFRDIQKDNV